MGNMFSDRISDVPRSFIREILKVAIDPSIISFAGGLPNRALFPVEEIRESTDRLLRTAGRDVLQYSSSEGYRPLREWIAKRYARQGMEIDPDHVLITSGSQQGLDLLGKTLLDERDHVVIEEPGYLGAIQAFAIYRATFHAVPLRSDGIDVDLLEEALRAHRVKIYYTVPNFQNPSGISYSDDVRVKAAQVVSRTRTVLIEDDPYGELRFLGKPARSFGRLAPQNTVLLGSFSKIVAPSLRIGWLVARDELMDRLLVAKQASDLHTNYLGQRIIHQYLMDHDVDAHIAEIRRAYGAQREAMVQAIRRHFPASVRFTEPEGGMFLWVTLPEGTDVMAFFDRAIELKVAFVPGRPFYVGRDSVPTLRLNFSSSDVETIETGIARLGRALEQVLPGK